MDSTSGSENPIYPRGHKTNPLKHNFIQVLLVDGEAAYRARLRHFCEAECDLVVVGEAEDETQAVRLAERCQPQVIVLGGVQAEETGEAVVQALHQACPEGRVVVVTEAGRFEQAFPALNAGAKADLPRQMDGLTLTQTIRAVYQGETLLNSQVTARIIQDLKQAFNHSA